MAFSEKDHMAGVLANTLLYSEAAQDKLIELLWERMSDEQKQSLTDTAFASARDRMEKIIESRIYAIGTGDRSHGRVNFFSRHVTAAVTKAFEAEKVANTINEIVQEQLTATKLGLRETVTTMVNTMTGSLVRSIIERVDVYSLQTALRDALKVGEKAGS